MSNEKQDKNEAPAISVREPQAQDQADLRALAVRGTVVTSSDEAQASVGKPQHTIRVIAECDGRISGDLVAHRPEGDERVVEIDRLTLWPESEAVEIAKRLFESLLEHEAVDEIRYVQTAFDSFEDAPQLLFCELAKQMSTRFRTLFADAEGDNDQVVCRLGPLDVPRASEG